MKRGSVLLEFMLMMPVLLVLFGATMLWMEISLGKMYIQEANRNLAWLSGDRYDDGRIKNALYDSAREPYELRNNVEKNFGGTGDMWKYASGSTSSWGRVERLFRNGGQRLKATENCKWNEMVSGNMNLRMAHLSGVYMGAVAIGSVLHPNGEWNHLYAASYDFTRAGRTASTNDTATAAVNIEAIVIRRARANDQRENINSPNKLLPLLVQTWPTDGTSWYELVGEIGIDINVPMITQPEMDIKVRR